MIGLYSPDVPPVPGGVADHTLALAWALARAGSPPVVFARRGDAERFAPVACTTGVGTGDLAAAVLRAGVRALILQYTPFLYARRGVAPAVVRAARTVADAGVRLALFVHEPFVPFTRLPWLVTGLPQRWQLRQLVRRAAWVYAGVPRFAEQAGRHARNGTVVRVVPVGATLAVSTASRSEARAALGLTADDVAVGVFSPGASGFLAGWIAAAAGRLASHPRVRWIRFGHGSDRPWDGWPAGGRTITLGEAPAEVVARTMRALDLIAAPYVDGLTLRRSSAMLALATGIATVSSTGSLFDPTAGALAACEPTAGAFAARLAGLVDDAPGRAALAARAGGYAAVASMERLVAILLGDLEPAAERRP